MIEEKTFLVTHENGYTGKLYGASEMSIYNKNGVEVFHTSFRNHEIQTEKDLYNELEQFPKFLSLLNKNNLENLK